MHPNERGKSVRYLPEYPQPQHSNSIHSSRFDLGFSNGLLYQALDLVLDRAVLLFGDLSNLLEMLFRHANLNTPHILPLVPYYNNLPISEPGRTGKKPKETPAGNLLPAGVSFQRFVLGKVARSLRGPGESQPLQGVGYSLNLNRQLLS